MEQADPSKESEKPTKNSGSEPSNVKVTENKDRTRKSNHSDHHKDQADDDVDRQARLIGVWIRRKFSNDTFSGIAGVFMQIILAALGILAGVIYWGQLQEMKKTTDAAILASQSACVAAQTAQSTLNELRAGGVDTHNVAVGAITQAVAYMRSESAQIKLTSEDSPHMFMGEPITDKVTFSNIGITPALDFVMQVEVRMIPKGKASKLIFNKRTRMEAGSIQKDQVGTITATMEDDRKPVALDPAIYGRFHSNNLYFVTYAKVTYRDIFGNKHWATLCRSTTFGQPHDRPDLANCSSYNRSDVEQLSKPSITPSIIATKAIDCPVVDASILTKASR